MIVYILINIWQNIDKYLCINIVIKKNDLKYNKIVNI